MKTKLVTVGAAAALAVVAAVVFTRGAHSSTRAPEQRQAPAPALGADGRMVQQVSGEIASLRAEVAALRAKDADAQGEKPAPGAAAQAPTPIADLPPEEQERLITEEIAARGDLIAAHMSSEPVDTAWGTKTDRAVRDVVSTQLPGSQVTGIKCGSTICEVSFTHDSLQDQHDVGKLAEIHPFETAAIYRYQKDVVPPRTTVYFAREGASLPALTD